MEPIQRLVVRDKHPLLASDLIRLPLNRCVLVVAGFSLVLQCVALLQVVKGSGRRLPWIDHFGFATVSFVWLLIGASVFLQRRGQNSGQLFLISAACGSVFLAFGSLFSAGFGDALAFCAGLLFFAPALLSFVRSSRPGRSLAWRDVLLLIPPVVFLLPSASALAANQTTVLWKLALISVALYLVAAIVQAWYDLRQGTTPHELAQGRALLAGLIAGTVPGNIAFIIPLVISDSLQVDLGWLAPDVLVFLLAMSCAVLLWEVSEADLIVRRGIVYGLLTVIILVAYSALGLVLAASRASVTGVGGGLGFIAVTVAVGAAFSPVQRLARRLVDWLLYGRSDRWRLLQDLSARLSVVMQPDDLGETLVREVVDALRLRGAFLLRRDNAGQYSVQHEVVSGRVRRHERAVEHRSTLDSAVVVRAFGHPPVPVLLTHTRPLSASTRTQVPERFADLDRLGVALAIPLQTSSGVEAVLCLGAKAAHDAFGREDLELMWPVVRQASAALDNALLFARLDLKIEELRQAYVRIAREQEVERARLARELHDGTAQELAALITLATVAGRQLDVDPDGARSTMEKVRKQAEDAYHGVRSASHALRPPMLDDFGIVLALRRYIDDFQESSGITVDSAVQAVGELSKEVEFALFRVAQECLENVRKHSGSKTACVSLHRVDGLAHLHVSDFGQGVTGNAHNGIGIGGMRERIESVGGAITMRSDAHGFQVDAKIPLGDEPA
ncbi:MAG: hypothetical protein NVSMB52_01630 [Chloroflexota bacterium]